VLSRLLPSSIISSTYRRTVKRFAENGIHISCTSSPAPCILIGRLFNYFNLDTRVYLNLLVPLVKSYFRSFRVKSKDSR
jgi:hypothetical protein